MFRWIFDKLLTVVLAAALIFWVVRLVLWLGENRPADWETAVVYGGPALYVLWFVFARIRGKKLIRLAAQQAPKQKTKAAEDTSGSFRVPADDGKAFTVTFNHVGTTSDAQFSKKDFIIPEKEKEPEEPLTGDFFLGSHHVSGTNAHIGMTVRYVAATHSVIYCHWSDREPEKEEVFPIPDHIRTKQALLDYVQRNTTIPSVWMY